MKLGIYIHIPFCASKCFYCDFYSVANKNLESLYINALIEDILSETELLGERLIDSIYIGGGTPSLIDENNIVKLLNILKIFCDENAEITIEVNPESVTREKLQAYFDAGINRLSIGLQSANDETLKKIGRLATVSDFENTYNMAVDIGFNNISCDVIIGLPDETIDMFEHTLNYILGLKHITHVSAYSLELHENTKLDFLVSNNFVTLPDENAEREMKYLLDKKLDKSGYTRYEISNYAKPGYESKHNLKYWNQEEYLGFGAAASSFVNSIRYTNISNIEKYINNISSGMSNKNEIEEMDKLGLIKEYIILKLRLKEGINLNIFKTKFKQDIYDLYKDKIDILISQGLLEKEGDNIRLTYKGEDLANLVWQEFI